MTTTTTTTLSLIQSQAITRLLAGQAVAAVARELKVDRSTIYDWRNQHPQFRQAIDQGRASLQEIAADALADLASTAIETLRYLLSSPTVPASVRLRAAESVLRAVQPPPPPPPPPQPASPSLPAEPALAAPSASIPPVSAGSPAARIPHNPTLPHTAPAVAAAGTPAAGDAEGPRSSSPPPSESV